MVLSLVQGIYLGDNFIIVCKQVNQTRLRRDYVN